jgi:hypothetical protein
MATLNLSHTSECSWVRLSVGCSRFHRVDNLVVHRPDSFIVHLLPLNKWLYLGLFGAVNVWTVLVSPRVLPGPSSYSG